VVLRLPDFEAWKRYSLKIEAMAADEIREVERLMKRGGKWQFLNEDESLVETIEEDADTLRSMKITPVQIANKLASLINLFHFNCVRARIYSGETIQEVEKRGMLIANRYFVRVIEELEYMERQPCYFEICRNIYSFEELAESNKRAGVEENLLRELTMQQYLNETKHHTASATYEIVDMRSIIFGRSLKFAAVMIHSIRDHHFFGGPKTRMRIDPKRVIKFLHLKPGEEYSPCRKQLDIWFRVDHTSSIIDDFNRSRLTRAFGDGIILQEGLVAYIWAQNGIVTSDRHLKFEQPLIINGVLVDLQGNEIHPGQTSLRHTTLFFDIG
jgi:hypothetical protein